MEVMFELGLLDEFLKLPHQKEAIIVERFGGRDYALADFRHLPTRAKFLALMPQWEFPELSRRARQELSIVPSADADAGSRADRGGGPGDWRAR